MTDPDFERLLEEFIMNELDGGTPDEENGCDMPLTENDDAEEPADCDASEATMTENTKIYLTMATEANNMKYYTGEIDIVVSLGRGLRILDAYHVCIYNEQWMLMAHAASTDEGVKRCGRSFSFRTGRDTLWSPGRYLFILHCETTGATLAAHCQLDGQATFHTDDMQPCSRTSDEAMLGGRLCSRLSYWRRLSRRGGMRQLRQWTVSRSRLLEVNALRSGLVMGELDFCTNLLIAAPSVAAMRATHLLLKNAAALPGTLKSIDCADLYDATNNNPYERLNELMADFGVATDNPLDNLAGSGKKALFLYNISALTDNGGRQVMRRLETLWTRRGTVSICGTRQELQLLLEQYPSLGACFPPENRISVEPFTAEELVQTAYERMASSHLGATPEALDRLCRLLVDAHSQGITSQWTDADVQHYLDQYVQPRLCQRLISQPAGGEPATWNLLQADDVDPQTLLGRTSAYEEALHELDCMVGLSDIKQRITTLAHRMHFYAERRQMGLRTTDGTAHHAIFTGNPGTGKTTVARLLGRIYHALGLLSRGDVICVDRTRMIGRYIGETEENMKHLLREARGNVLFVDEAYTLCCGDDSRDFGRHVIDSLLTVLAQPEPDMLVIFAGYEREMNALMATNPGLVGRFPYKFRFSDYTVDELMLIATRLLAADEYTLSDEARTMLRQTVADAVAMHSPQFGNARWVEQLVRNGIIPALADRLATAGSPNGRDAYQRIEAADVKAACLLYNPKTIELKPRQRVGFSA